MEKNKSPRAVTVSKMFMTNTGNLFSMEDLKAYELPQTKQIDDEGNWSVSVIEPPYNLLKLMSWLDLSVVHSSCVRAKVQDSVGVGFRLVEIEESNPTDEEYNKLLDFFNKCNESEDIISVCKKVCLDYEACGNGYFEVIRGMPEEGVKALYHVSAPTLKMSKEKDKWVQIVGQKKVYFKVWGDERILNKETGNFVKGLSDPEKEANEIIQIKQYTYKSKVYGLPEWLPALFQMYGEMKEKEYNLDFFSNYGIPAYAVILEGAELDVDTKKEIQKYFEIEIKGNPHRTMVFSTPEGATVKFERLSVEQKEASFRVYRKDNRDDILTAHHVPPYRAAIVEKGQLGGSVSEDMDRIYLDSVINPRQRDFTWILTELIIWEGFKIETLRFEFLDIDIRDNKAQADVDKAYFAMGAKTPNQMLIAQGEDPYEGGDVYYVPANLVPIGVTEVKRFEKRQEEKKRLRKRCKSSKIG